MKTENKNRHFTLSSLKRPDIITSQTKQRVIFVRDVSLSMDDDNKKVDASNATSDLLTELSLPENKDGFYVGVIDYSKNAKIMAEFTKANDLEGTLSEIETEPYTNIASGLEKARSMIDQAPEQVQGEERYLRSVVILFTDGENNHGDDPIEASNQLKEVADLVTVAFGSDADIDLLREIATSREHCYRCREGRELRAFLAAVGETLSGSLQMGQNATQPLSAIDSIADSQSYSEERA